MAIAMAPASMLQPPLLMVLTDNVLLLRQAAAQAAACFLTSRLQGRSCAAREEQGEIVKRGR
jgi:hypothetical protein